jgi:cell wall-associated NlpC family hydrolase
MERFIYKYAQYNFSNGMGLKDYFFHNFTSWQQDENLSDPTPFINYQGSMRQFLEDVVAKPFNELFFEYTSLGQCVALMRPTPFDPDKWYQLPTYRFSSDIVTQESFGKNDNEMYSVYIVNVPNILDFNSMDLGVYPKFHPDLIKKYGYKRLDADNRYLLTSGAAAALNDATATDSSGEAPPTYSDLVTFMAQSNYTDPETLRTQKNNVYAAIKDQFPALSKATINSIIDEVKAKTLTQEHYNTILATNGDGKASKQVNKEKSVASEKLDVYTQRLFNWYCENANFYSGDIRVLGNPAYRIGTRILYDDFEEDTTWEFYLESVQHDFAFTSGYTTILGVTRGLPEQGVNRFTNLWGQSEDFKGGYLGEMSLQDLVASAKQAQSDALGNSDPSQSQAGNATGGDTAMKALSTAQSLVGTPAVYTFGGGRSGANPFYNSPIRADCSSFVWWCYNTYGVSLNGGKSGMTTDTIAKDSRLTTVSTRGTSKDAAFRALQQGDLIWFDTYKADGHIGIYAGNGQFINCSEGHNGHDIVSSDLTNSYWWSHFNGHVARYNG